MHRTIPARGLFVIGVIFLFGVLNSSSAKAQPSSNGHIQLVELHLRDHKYELPKGDYVLFAEQPQGIVTTVVVHDLTQGTTTFIPGTHNREQQKTILLTADKSKLLRDVAALDAVRTLPRESGFSGLDGSAFVAMIKIGDRTQQIGHWAPDAVGVALLMALYRHDHERRVFENPRYNDDRLLR